MMLRGSPFPSAPGRYPVSIGCPISVRISITSPRLADAGTLIRARAMISAVPFYARSQRDHHVGGVRPERAVAEPCHGPQFLRRGEPDTRRYTGLSGTRAEHELGHLGLRVALV